MLFQFRNFLNDLVTVMRSAQVNSYIKRHLVTVLPMLFFWGGDGATLASSLPFLILFLTITVKHISLSEISPITFL